MDRTGGGRGLDRAAALRRDADNAACWLEQPSTHHVCVCSSVSFRRRLSFTRPRWEIACSWPGLNAVTARAGALSNGAGIGPAFGVPPQCYVPGAARRHTCNGKHDKRLTATIWKEGSHRHADANQAAGNGVLQRVVLSLQGDDAAVDGNAAGGAVRRLRDDPWADLHLLPHLQHALWVDPK